MADQFDEFLNEVEQDIRQERFEKLWQKYGKLALYVFGGCIALAAVYTMWSNNQEAKRVQISEAYIRTQSLIDSGKTDEAIHALQAIIAEGKDKAYGTLSQFALAGIRAAEGPYQDLPKAIEFYKGLEGNTSIEPYQRQFAGIRAITLEASLEENKNNPDALKGLLAKLEPLSDEKSPWRLLALEAQGIIITQLNDPKASEVFVKIAQDPNCPKGMRARAQLMARSQANALDSTKKEG